MPAVGIVPLLPRASCPAATAPDPHPHAPTTRCTWPAGNPAISGVSPERLRARWQALQLGVEGHRPWRQQLAALTPPALARCLLVPEAELGRLQVGG